MTALIPDAAADAQAQPQSQPLSVYILAGQSNMVGLGKVAVRNAQATVATADPLVEIFSVSGLACQTDKVHDNADGQVELGKRFAKAFLSRRESRR